jgi:UDP-N-acetylglucosamine 2-epimerase (non-hydrolysing)
VKLLIVVGARPNFMKAAPLLAAIQAYNAALNQPDGNSEAEQIRTILVHTGQHYDEQMSEQFFADLNLRRPDINLGVGSASHAVQTAEVMTKFEPVLMAQKPDAMIVVGDVNSTIACAMVAAKVSYGHKRARPLIVHVEAGLRSFDRSMPEEVNRVLTDHIADLLFVTEESAVRNLRDEGVPDSKIHFVGNTMIDSLLMFTHKAEASTILYRVGMRRHDQQRDSGNGLSPFVLLTLHRPGNVDDPSRFVEILEGLQPVSTRWPIFFPVHPRTRQRITTFQLERYFSCNGEIHPNGIHGAGIRLLDPLGYPDFVCMMKHAVLVVTDSGGIQEETTCLGVPCVTVRDNTERPVTVTCGTNVIAGTASHSIREAIERQIHRAPAAQRPEKWDGKAAQRIVQIIATELQGH